MLGTARDLYIIIMIIIIVVCMLFLRLPRAINQPKRACVSAVTLKMTTVKGYYYNSSRALQKYVCLYTP